MDSLVLMGILAVVIGVIGLAVLYAGRRPKQKGDSVEQPGGK